MFIILLNLTLLVIIPQQYLHQGAGFVFFLNGWWLRCGHADVWLDQSELDFTCSDISSPLKFRPT